MDESPGNVFNASQWVQRALHIPLDVISNMTAVVRFTGTVQITAPHSLQTSSASLPVTFTTMQPQQSTPPDSCGMIGTCVRQVTP